MSVAWVGLGVSAIGAIAGASSAEDAEDTQYAATQAGKENAAENTTLQRRMYEEGVKRNEPFLNAGTAGINKLSELLGLGTNTGAAGFGSMNQPFKFDGSNLASDPGYQFQQQQGQKALDRRQAAGGGFYSGEGLNAAAQFNQGLAATSFGDAYNRQFNAFQTERANTLNPLQSLAGLGQTQANQANITGQINANAQTGINNSLSGLITNQGNATAAGQIAQGNALTSGINNGLTSWQRSQYANGLNGMGGVGSGSTFFNDPTDASGWGAVNGSDFGWRP